MTLDYDGRDTILREEFEPGSHQLKDMDGRTLHPVIRKEDWDELAKFSWSLRHASICAANLLTETDIASSRLTPIVRLTKVDTQRRG